MNHFIKEYFKQAFRWQKGRQGTGYDKMLILHSFIPLPFDIYIIRYYVGSFIPPHVDKVDFGEHYRLNIILKKSKLGGDFICKDPIYESNRIKFFRPDKSEHSVTEVKLGQRYLLSIGWVLKNKKP